MSYDAAQLNRQYGNSAPLQYPSLIAPPMRSRSSIPDWARTSPGERNAAKKEMEEMARMMVDNFDYGAAVTAGRSFNQQVLGTFAEQYVEPQRPAPAVIHPVHRAPSHTAKVFNQDSFPALAKWAAAVAQEAKLDAIMACGHSGLVLAGAVSVLTGIPVIAVRKEGEPTVACTGQVSAVLHKGPAQRWGWLDDLIGSGGTMLRSIKAALREDCITGHLPHLVILYCGAGKDGICEPDEVYESRWATVFPDYKGPRLFDVKRYHNR